jgi:hypothetical protein
MEPLPKKTTLAGQQSSIERAAGFMPTVPHRRPKAGGSQTWLIALWLIPLAFCPAGCITTGSFLLPGTTRPAADVRQVVVAWNPEVVFTPDPTHGGEPTPGVAGRLYLFGPEIDRPLVGDGCLVVDLFDNRPGAGGKDAVPLEEWRIDRDTLKRLEKKDAIGCGYTLFLPWATYHPELTQVRLRLRYEPAKGTPLYADSGPVVFHHSDFSYSADTRPPPSISRPTQGVTASMR